jgi:lathosterol oxidase
VQIHSGTPTKMTISMSKFAIIAVLCGVCAASPASTAFWFGDVSDNIARMKAGTYSPYVEFNEWVNSLILPESAPQYLYSNLGPVGGYYATTYLRDLITGTAVYWITASLWHLFIYVIFADRFFKKEHRPFPTTAIIVDQMMLAQSSIFMYAALPVLSEFLIESGFTKTYFFIEEIGGWGWYFFYLALYLTCVEIGIYWMHRTLHTNKFLYKYVHSLHHKYNSAATLTPWSSIAFNPIDGILQASPYVACLTFIPVNFYTHVFLLFFSGVWATNIHDALWGDTEPIMGAKYHTLHHTHYHYNYGQFFIFCDYFWGTLRLPEKSLLNPHPLTDKEESSVPDKKKR